MRAYIKLWGNEYLLDSVCWSNGKITDVSFEDESGKYRTVFKKSSWEEDAELNRHTNEVLHSDFDKTVIWKQK
ncbi:hypothetical protein ACDI16_02070 [Oceanobacillus caeni]